MPGLREIVKAQSGARSLGGALSPPLFFYVPFIKDVIFFFQTLIQVVNKDKRVIGESLPFLCDKERKSLRVLAKSIFGEP